ncbi:hypothetical protein VOLCADRAFT_88009 [Volvox carteri f. nagariensis]|uniref:Uncharacterized protein n=1 Tax=Volvox carteri f. nagariensis TaxID=3068 RepID=D8TMU2_VOLCA|nr:uncharacterized protein VOLCADRAFT_88009 [Volvox carteri f. nagariensis]EFJ51313.1 hypothetical protein VOLCADRAFT_88009 [Volvox carteri f. nagariensis]|eukprot:XP_002947780.1 hypothetical protein VOLCADRAFT_88009 [Volvox carteri f. nagariensis]
MAEVVRPGMAAAPIRHPPSAFAEVQQQSDGIDLNLESLLPADLTFAIEFAQPAKPSKPPAYKPTALPTQLLQPSTSAIIPPHNPWSFDSSLDSVAGRSNSSSQNQQYQLHQQPPPLLPTSRSVPDRSVYSSHHNHHNHNYNHFNYHQHNQGASSSLSIAAGAAASPRPPATLPPPPPPPRGAATFTSAAAAAAQSPISPAGGVRVSSSSSSNASPRQSPIHSRSAANSDYGSGASHDEYYAIGQPPPPPPRDGGGAVPAAVQRTVDGPAGQRGTSLNRSFVRRNSASSGSNYNNGGPPPPPPPPRDGATAHASYCPPLDLGSLTTATGDGSVLVTQSSRGGAAGTPGGVAAPAAVDCWPPPPPPPPPSKSITPRPSAHLQPPAPPPPPPPRSDQECLRSRSSSSSTVPFNTQYGNGYPSILPPPPPPPRRSPGAGPTADGLYDAAAVPAAGGDVDTAAGFKFPTVQEAQMLVAAALQDGTDSSLAAALELSSKLQTLAAQRIAASSQSGKPSPPPSAHNHAAAGQPAVAATATTLPGVARSPSPLGGSGVNGRGSFTGQQPPPPPPTDSGRLASMGSGASGLYSRNSATARGGSFAPPPPPPPPRHPSSGSGLTPQSTSSASPPPPPPPPRAPVPQPPSADVAAVMATLPEVRSPFALYQRASDDDDCCPTPPDETAVSQEQLQQLSHFGTSAPCGFAANSSTAAAAAAAAAAVAAASSAPYVGNPYMNLFGVNALAPSVAPYGGGGPANPFAGAASGAPMVNSGAFGSDVFGTASLTSSVATGPFSVGGMGSHEVSLASLTSLLTTLAALAKQGGGGGRSSATAAAVTSLGTVSLSPVSDSTAVSCNDPSVPGTPEVKAPNQMQASPDVATMTSPTSVSIAGSDDMSAASSGTDTAAVAAVLAVHAQSSLTPPVSPPASTVAIDEATPDSSELAVSTVAAAAAAATVPSPRDFAVPAPGAPSLAALQQALALLAAEVSSPPAPLSPPQAVGCAADAGLCTAALSLPGLMGAAQDLQMARSLHAALKVAALLDSLSSTP